MVISSNELKNWILHQCQALYKNFIDINDTNSTSFGNENNCNDN